MVQVQFVSGQLLGSRGETPYERCSYSGYRGNFVTVAGVMDVWSVVLQALPVPAGKGEHEEDQ